MSRNDYMALEAAAEYACEGDEVLFLGCDQSFGICHENEVASPVRCLFCTHQMHVKVMEFKNKFPKIKVSYKKISNYYCPQMVTRAQKYDFTYNSVKELKSIRYKAVDIGFSAFSNYVSFTRNVMPEFNDYFHSYIDYMLRKQVLLVDVVESLLTHNNYSLIIFHNGRFANLKALYCLAKKLNIDFVTTEVISGADGWKKKNNFVNNLPHTKEACLKKVDVAWEKCGEKGMDIGQTFFVNRRNAKPAGDKIYTANQIQGKLPENIDNNKRIISIFNSSEDEFFSISKEIDDYALFENQYTALKTIFEHYKDNRELHFYLRIHPNLANVPYKSHTILYDLKYDNVTIIPPMSDISSYALMDISEKVIVFNSTMGLESAYWGKPVIALAQYIYDKVEYCPNSTNELFELIDNRFLPCKKVKMDCCKIATYLLGYHGEKFLYFPDRFYDFRFFGKPLKVHSQFKLFGSDKLKMIIEGIICHLSRPLDKFKNIASRTC